jgi:hypothetical protein
VAFPDREEGPPVDPTSPLRVSVFDITGPPLEYPMTVEGFLEKVAHLVYGSDELMTWTEFGDQVRHVEGVGVRVGRVPFAPYKTWDDLVLDAYPYSRAMPGGKTVAQLRRTRLEKGREFFIFEVFRPDGSAVPGQTRLSTVRQLWADQPRSEPVTRDRLREWATRAREEAWYLSVLDEH